MKYIAVLCGAALLGGCGIIPLGLEDLKKDRVVDCGCAIRQCPWVPVGAHISYNKPQEYQCQVDEVKR